MRIHLLALLTWLSTFVLILAGGVVHATGSSMACPDWPTCYGTFFPEMAGGIFFEHGHRILGTWVGGLTLLLALLLRRRHGWCALALVIVQGVLGGLTVIFRLPIWISTLHLAVSQAFFVLLAWLVVRTHPAWEGMRLRPGVLAQAALVYVQVVLGALVRHGGAGMVCGAEFPLCNGAWLPDDGLTALNVLHRAIAVPILGGALVLAWRSGGLLAWTTLAAVTLQIGLGVASLYGGLGIELVTAHLGTGALLLTLLSVQAWGLGAGACRCRQAPGRLVPGLPPP